MDYSIQRVVERHGADENTKEYGAIGAMPDDSFLAKYEFTNVGEDDDEELLNEYQREAVARGHGTDAPLFEHEEARRNPEAATGRLRMQYGGHRGDADDPAHPEAMLDFYGEIDPRGINVDPDMSQVRDQSLARGRFIGWGRDGGVDAITGGSAGEFRIMQDKRKAWAQAGAKIKVFSRTIDGKQNGMRKEWQHVNMQKLTKKGDEHYGEYSELIKEDAINPANNGTVLAQHLLSKSAMYINGTNQQDLAVARDTFSRRRRSENATLRAIKAAENQIDFSKSEMSRLYKSLAETMHSQTKIAQHAATDAEFAAAGKDANIAKKMVRADENLRRVMGQIKQQHDVAHGYTATAAHQAAPGDVMVNANFVVQDAEDPSSYKLISEKIYKIARAGPEDNQLVWNGIGDEDKQVIPEHFSVTKNLQGREKYTVTQSGANIDIGDDQTRKIPTYSAAIKRAANVARQTKIRGEDYASESKNTQSGKVREYMSIGVNQKRDRVAADNKFGENIKMDKSAKPIGVKERARAHIQESMDRDMMDFGH